MTALTIWWDEYAPTINKPATVVRDCDRDDFGVGCALLGQWGQFFGVIAATFALMLLTSGCLTFCHRRGWQPGSGMLLALVTATGYVLVILGSYGYLLHS
ncbi:hypothetical protein ACT5GY_01570 [Lactiplantibacillus plantarum]